MGRLLLCSLKPFVFSHGVDLGLVGYGQRVGQRGTLEVEAAKSSVLPTPRAATVMKCHYAQAFDRRGTPRKTR